MNTKVARAKQGSKFKSGSASASTSADSSNIRNIFLPQPLNPVKTLFNIHNNFNFKSVDKVVTFKELDEGSSEFENITDLITNQYLVVDIIKKVNNPFLMRAFQLKKIEKLLDYPDLEEKLLFHATKEANVMDICKYNFNWRYVKKHRFGKGVNFSTNAKYASNYSDEESEEKYMFLAQVLVGSSCLGNSKYVLPPGAYDTTTKGDGIVTVKYEDNEFYPKYLMTYHFDYSDYENSSDSGSSDSEISDSESDYSESSSDSSSESDEEEEEYSFSDEDSDDESYSEDDDYDE